MIALSRSSISTIDSSTRSVCLLCATASPYWARHLLMWLPQVACGHAAVADERNSTLHWTSTVNPGAFPASHIEFLRLTNDDTSALSNRLLSLAHAVVLCVQGHNLDLYEHFLGILGDVQRRERRKIPLLVLTGLIGDEDLGILQRLCRSCSLVCTFHAVSSVNDRETLAHLSSFLLDLQVEEDDAPMSSFSEEAQPQHNNERTDVMASINESMADLLKIDGAIGTALVDSSSGMVMGKGGSGVNLDAAAAGNTEVVRAKLKTMKALGLEDAIEDILITLGKQFHIIRPLGKKPTVFIYLVLDKEKANLAMARYKVAEIEGALAF